MSQLVRARLVNGPFGDPGIFVDFVFGRRALLFDLGDLSPLSPRELMRVSHAFVSHRHMDHFAGFDQLLRARLHRPGTLSLVGPAGLTAGVAAKLAAYSWNLLDGTSPPFVLRAADVADGHLGAWTAFRARDAFRASDGGPSGLDAGLVLSEDDCHVEAATLDHGVPCLAFALQERLRINVDVGGLERLGLSVGPWLNAAKSAARRGAAPDAPIAVGEGRAVPLGLLAEHALRAAPGQRLAYVTDAAFHPDNAERIVALARDADHLFIEAVFLAGDEALARLRRHLTARQAGELARRAGARRITTFHHSPRYLDRPDALAAEAEAAFRGDQSSANRSE